ncbi:unnamed protein product [Caenorhabditis brenneri]
MESQIQLTDLPEDPMRHILEMCDFVTLQRLRKTCHTFRNFIEETKPVQRMNEFHVSGLPESLSLKIVGNNNYDLYPNGGKVELGYKDLGDGNTKITWQRMDGNRERIIENSDNLDIFSGDFGTIFGCTQPKWDKISLSCDVAVLEKFQGKLSSLKSPLKVHNLSISSIENQNLVVEIIKSVCPDTLSHLHFLTPYENWNMSEMVKMEQWKKAKELSMPFVRASADIESFFHFESATICFENVTMDDLCKLKELFLNTSSITKRFEFYSFKSLNKNIVITTLGDPYVSGNPASNYWYFERDDDYALCMNYTEDVKCFDFSIITKADIPLDAVTF